MAELANDRSSQRGDDLEKGIGRLVVTLIDVLRQLMERQADHRMAAGSLTDEETERLGHGFMRLEDRMQEVKRVFGLDETEELDVQLGTLEGEQISVVELADRILKRGVVVEADATLTLADIDLLYAALRVVIASPETAASRGSETAGGG